MTEVQIKDEAIKYCSHIDFTNDTSLNEKGRQRVKEWCQQDFIAGANWMQEQKQIKISSNLPVIGQVCDHYWEEKPENSNHILLVCKKCGERK